MMPPPGAGRQFIVPPWLIDPAGSADFAFATRPYVAPLPFTEGPRALNAPGLDLPFLYHAGTARDGTGAPVASDQPFDDGSAITSYRPAVGREWGRPGYMPRIPRTVIVQPSQQFFAPNDPTTFALIAGIQDACTQAGASLLIFNGVNTLSPLTDWAPPSVGRPGPLIAPVSESPVPSTTWLAGDVLFIVCTNNSLPQYLGYIAAGLPPDGSYQAAGYQVFELTGKFVGDIVGVDLPLINAARQQLTQLMTRCNRFAGIYLYDPNIYEAPSNSGFTAAVYAAINPDDLWKTTTTGLPWTRVAVPGSSQQGQPPGTPINFLFINQQIQTFFADVSPPPPPPPPLPPLSGIVISNFPTPNTPVVAGGDFHSFQVTVFDKNGNVLTNHSGVLLVSTNDRSAVFNPPYVQISNAQNWQATFSVQFNEPSGNQVLSAQMLPDNVSGSISGIVVEQA